MNISYRLEYKSRNELWKNIIKILELNQSAIKMNFKLFAVFVAFVLVAVAATPVDRPPTPPNQVEVYGE